METTVSPKFASSPHTAAPVGLLAGWGRFPFVFAEKARSLNIPVVCVGIRDEAAPELAEMVDRFHWAGVAKLGRIIRCFKKEGVQQIVMAGKIHKVRMNTPFRLWRLLPEPCPEARSRLANAGLLVWSIALLVIALLTGIAGAYAKGFKEGQRAALGFPRGFVAGLLVDSLLRRADSLNHMATALENTPGAMKKYCQLRIATPTEQIASAHLRTGRSIRRSRGSPPSCHARTAANRRKTVTKSPNPVKKSQYVRENP